MNENQAAEMLMMLAAILDSLETIDRRLSQSHVDPLREMEFSKMMSDNSGEPRPTR